MLSLVTFLPAFLLNHIEAVAGYAICVLFPIPYLNAAIIDVWAKVGTKLTTLFAGSQSEIETSLETAIAGATSAAVTTALSGGTGVASVTTGSTTTNIVATPSAVVQTTTKNN